MEQLKPCPFCGGLAYVEIVRDEYPEGGNRLRFGIACRRCGAELRDRVNKMEAVEAWNTRAERTCYVDEGKLSNKEQRGGSKV